MANFFSTLFGSANADAARAAAQRQFEGEQKALEGVKVAGDNYASGFRDLSTRFDPYSQAGGAALERLMGGLGLSPGGSEAFTNAYRSLPGYQAGLDSGGRAIDYSASARGMGQSGRTLKDLYRFGSNYEDQRSGDYLSRLMALGQQGQQATAQGVNTAGMGLTGQLNAATGTAPLAFKSGGTLAAGDIAAANADNASAQNLLNAGLKVGGMFLGGGFPGSSFFGGR